MNSVIYYVSNTEEALALCSEFSDQYGVSVQEENVIAVFLKRKYYEELCRILDRKGFSLASFEAYGKDVLIQFRPKIKK
jgi:hypothetical protein